MITSVSWTIFIVVIFVSKWLWEWTKASSSRQAPVKSLQHDATKAAPYRCEPIKGRQKFCLTMGLRKLDTENWLTIDKNYLPEHQIRDDLLRNERENVYQCLPESKAACEEVVEEVVDFLCERYPTLFEKKSYFFSTQVLNKKTGEKYNFGGRHCSMEPLEIAVRLAMEDFSVLMQNEQDEYYLAASATLFPVGWSVKDRIGWTLARLHAPVPGWQEKIGRSVNKFMCRLTPDAPMERCNYFLETKRPGEGMQTTLFRPTGLTEVEESNASAEDLLVRRERQTFRRLPRSGALVFGVRTTLTPLVELSFRELHNLVTEVRSWPQDMALYKGRHIWGNTVMMYYAEKAEFASRDNVA